MFLLFYYNFIHRFRSRVWQDSTQRLSLQTSCAGQLKKQNNTRLNTFFCSWAFIWKVSIFNYFEQPFYKNLIEHDDQNIWLLLISPDCVNILIHFKMNLDKLQLWLIKHNDTSYTLLCIISTQFLQQLHYHIIIDWEFEMILIKMLFRIFLNNKHSHYI